MEKNRTSSDRMMQEKLADGNNALGYKYHNGFPEFKQLSDVLPSLWQLEENRCRLRKESLDIVVADRSRIKYQEAKTSDTNGNR